MTTINEQRTARHKSARVTEREEGHSAKLFGHGQPAQHVLRLPGGPGLGGLAEDLLDHRGHDVTGAEAVDADAMSAPFHGEAPSELDDGRLGGVVYRGSHTLVGDESAHAGDEEDGAPALVVEHLPGGGRGGVEDAVVVDLHDLVQLGLVVVDGALQVVDPRGGDEAVETLRLGCDGRHGVVHVDVVADVDAAVLEAAAVRGLGALLGGSEFGVWGFEAIHAVYFISFAMESQYFVVDSFILYEMLCEVTFGTSFHQRFCHGEPESSSSTGDGEDAVLQIEFTKPLSILPA